MISLLTTFFVVALTAGNGNEEALANLKLKVAQQKQELASLAGSLQEAADAEALAQQARATLETRHEEVLREKEEVAVQLGEAREALAVAAAAAARKDEALAELQALSEGKTQEESEAVAALKQRLSGAEDEASTARAKIQDLLAKNEKLVDDKTSFQRRIADLERYACLLGFGCWRFSPANAACFKSHLSCFHQSSTFG